MTFIQSRIGQFFPVSLILLGNGEIVFEPLANFPTIFDQPEEGKIGAIFHADRFSIGNYTDLVYNTNLDYKEMPDVLRWLKEQQLVQTLWMV